MNETGDMRPTHDVRAEYTRRLKGHWEETERCTRQERVLGNWRLVVVAIGLVMAWLALGPSPFSLWWLVVPLLAFLALGVRLDRVVRQHQNERRAVSFYENGLLRVNDRWAGSGTAGTRYADPKHPYGVDLDVFGSGSLFELLCTARTQAGEDCLADWLRAPASPEEIRARQAAVAELKPRLDLREELALLGEEVRSAIEPAALVAWGMEPIRLTSHRARIAAALLAVCTVGAAIGWATGTGALPFFLLAALERLFDLPLRTSIKQVLRDYDKPTRGLELLAALLTRIEKEQFESPLLKELHAALQTEMRLPSARILRLQTLIDCLNGRNSAIFAPIDLIVMWTTQFTFALEAWRAENGANLERWLRAVGEFEALCALAGYAHEHPDDPFPEIIVEGACFAAEGMTHPLLPAIRAVLNDIRIGDGTRLFIVSGSNMSGKSTLLRAIGVNVILALAGAPVRARSLRLTPLQLGASIRTQDSLQGGISRFYAEILRLRQIVDLADESLPLLFLLDEILHGTNSHDRRVGAEAVVRALLRRHTLGLMTTHDLALARIADDSSLGAVNVHFQDHLEDGKMTFDYRLRSGIVEKSNAIELMRAVGLEV